MKAQTSRCDQRNRGLTFARLNFVSEPTTSPSPDAATGRRGSPRSRRHSRRRPAAAGRSCGRGSTGPGSPRRAGPPFPCLVLPPPSSPARRARPRSRSARRSGRASQGLGELVARIEVEDPDPGLDLREHVQDCTPRARRPWPSSAAGERLHAPTHDLCAASPPTSRRFASSQLVRDRRRAGHRSRSLEIQGVEGLSPRNLTQGADLSQLCRKWASTGCRPWLPGPPPPSFPRPAMRPLPGRRLWGKVRSSWAGGRCQKPTQPLR